MKKPTFALPLLLISAVCFLLALSAAPASACQGPPIEPFCGKSVSLSLAAPDVILLPGGGTFDIPALVWLSLWHFPPGFGACPSGPYTAVIDVTVTCTPSGDGGGTIPGVFLTPGFNELSVSVTLPAGPPRICTVDGLLTVTMLDGMTLTETADTVVCLAEPAPDAPDLPRLDLEILEPGAEITRVHPGDQASYVYRITNNDPTESYAGDLTIDSKNESRMPGSSGPMPTGFNVVSMSDPLIGDHFPIALEQDLFNGCIALPPDPLNPAIPTIVEPILLPPGEFIDIPVFARPWGMCSDGSCNRSTLVLDGEFSDMSSGLACSGFVTAADTGAAPTYAWPDAGQVAQIPSPMNPNLPQLTINAQPTPMFPVSFDLLMQQVFVEIPDQPPIAGQQFPFAEQIHPESGRIQMQVLDPLFEIDSPFDVFFELQFTPPPQLELQIQGFLPPNAPSGFEGLAPYTTARGFIEDPVLDLLAAVDVTLQPHVVGIDDTNARRALTFQDVQFDLLSDRLVGVRLSGGQVEPGPGTKLQALELALDFRGFSSEQPQLSAIFEDGFESGNTSRWSTQTP